MSASKYARVKKPKRSRWNKEWGTIEEFDAAARARGLTYAQAQVEETCSIYQRRIVVPAHYRKVGDRGLRE